MLAVRRSPALRESFLNWSLFFLIGFEALVFTPMATFLFRFYPQWSMLYWFDPQIFPALERWIGLMSAVFVLVNFGAVLLGYSVTRIGVLGDQTWLWSLPIGAATLLIAYFCVGYWDRLIFIGDYDAFWQGNAELIFTKFAGWFGILAYGAGIWLVLMARKKFAKRDPSLL
ncbi:MAG: hypothetical protein A2289_23935 [Deltaproteobacteria bacterium RIFOXYA12_FULL_58_15]|nr:MAG: hypothetical protein A2289_23935 [Deltaproteobacteria bacterium RIFOXYA12_FULL_58_15]OGR12969.1 MAG: hypothetical protein A2341_05545 [Deltaproteobacteria bacterium RIFOXYB12_FULL_58_9]